MNTYGAILCAGLGSRMLPFTQVLPKPLLPFLNTPMIAYTLNHLANAGITRVSCNLCHLADTIPPVVDSIASIFDISTVYAREWEMLGTAGGVRGMWEALGSEEDALLVVMNGDSIMNIDLRKHIDAHVASGAEVSLLVRPRAEGQPGSVWLDASASRLARVRDHQHPDFDASLTGQVEYDFAGVHFINASLIKRLALEPGDIITELYGPMLEAGERINVCITTDFWAAIDNPELYMQTTRACLDDPTLFAQNPAAQAAQGGLALLDGNRIDDAAQFCAPVFTGAQVAIGAGAKIGPHVVLDGVAVAPGTHISNAVIYGMGEIEGDWSDCLAMVGQVKAVDSLEAAQESS